MKKALNRFKDHKIKVEGKLEKSVSQYLYRFEAFAEYMNIESYEDLVNIKANDVKKWLSDLADKGNGARTRNIKLTAIKEIYNYLMKEEKQIIDNDILEIKFAKVPKREINYIDKEDRDDFIQDIKNPCIKTGAAVIFGCGCRFSELMQITCTDILKGYSKIIGKGNKERTIYFPLWVQEIAKQWINGKRMKIVKKNGKQTDILMLNKYGEPISLQGFSKGLKLYGKKFNDNPLTEGRMEWNKQLSPHKIRHSFATEQIQEGVDLPTVRDEMGHSNLATTNNYSHSNEDRVRMAMLREDNKSKEKQEYDEQMKYLKKIMENKELFEKIKEMMGDDNNGK